MNDNDRPRTPPRPPNPRAERLAKALRANLRRRKASAAAPQEGERELSESGENPPQERD